MGQDAEPSLLIFGATPRRPDLPKRRQVRARRGASPTRAKAETTGRATASFDFIQQTMPRDVAPRGRVMSDRSVKINHVRHDRGGQGGEPAGLSNALVCSVYSSD